MKLQISGKILNYDQKLNFGIERRIPSIVLQACKKYWVQNF